MTEIVSETLKIPSFYVAVKPIPALYASGRTTGVVLDAREDVTNVVSIYEGYILPHACERLNVAGRKLTVSVKTSFLQAAPQCFRVSKTDFKRS